PESGVSAVKDGNDVDIADLFKSARLTSSARTGIVAATVEYTSSSAIPRFDTSLNPEMITALLCRKAVIKEARVNATMRNSLRRFFLSEECAGIPLGRRAKQPY